MKKEYLLLAIIIAALAAYLMLYQEDRTHYTLPEFAAIKKDTITAIELTKKDNPIVFTRDNDRWVLTDDKFTADPSAVENMLDVIGTLKLTTLVSETGDLSRYQLDEENRIGVRAMSDGTVVREFFIGKEAPTFNHTFVSLKSDQNVYHASGSFKTTFEKDVDGFRDKTVLAIPPEKIQMVSIEKDGIQKKMIRESNPDNANGGTDKPEEDIAQWVGSDGSAIGQDSARSLISGLSDVKCERFLTSGHKTEMEKSPFLFTIMINDDIYLRISPKNDDSLYTGVSSQSSQAFLLNSQKTENFIQDIDKLLGIEKDEKTDEGNSM